MNALTAGVSERMCSQVREETGLLGVSSRGTEAERTGGAAASRLPDSTLPTRQTTHTAPATETRRAAPALRILYIVTGESNAKGVQVSVKQKEQMSQPTGVCFKGK